tara:strand:+ start:1638 stop:1898 length:261 start_codon:yes stop_codon:yes gene_type:complete
MGNKKINEVAEGVAIHMQELLEDTVDWQMKEFYGMVPSERNKVMKLSMKKLKNLVDKETKRADFYLDKWEESRRIVEVFHGKLNVY